MAERSLAARLHRSVFARLVVIMLTLAASLMAVVGGFFVLYLGPHASRPFGGPTDRAHTVMLVLLLLIMAAALFAAHAVLSRLLRPLRALSDGVARLGEGQLDVALPSGAGDDEFGKLTVAFNAMVARVRGMIVARDQLLLDVSHELRSPLTRMKVALELLPEGAQRSRLASDVSEMEQMVTGLLELERLRAGGGRGVRPVRQDLAAIVREVAASFTDRAPGVRVAAAPAELPADVDGDQVRTVLRNPLDNAVKYSMSASRPVEVAVERTADAAIVRVTDDGVGIPDEDLGRVFEPFFRVDRSRTKSTGGYGLGLSICKRIMEAHGGSIAARRRDGGGTTFALTFPLPR
jgi:signal transduction histidine kinase